MMDFQPPPRGGIARVSDPVSTGLGIRHDVS
jgi:hypothetical protein